MTTSRLKGRQRRFRLTPPYKALALLAIIILSWFLGGSLLEFTEPSRTEPANERAKPPIVIVVPPAVPQTIIDAGPIEHAPPPRDATSTPEHRSRL